MRPFVNHIVLKGPDAMAKPRKSESSGTVPAVPNKRRAGKNQGTGDATAAGSKPIDGAASDGDADSASSAKSAQSPQKKAPRRRRWLIPMFFGAAAAVLISAYTLYLAHANGWILLSVDVDGIIRRLDAQEREIESLRVGLADRSSEIESLQDAVNEAQELSGFVSGLVDDMSLSIKSMRLDIKALFNEAADLSELAQNNDIRLSVVESRPAPKVGLPAELAESNNERLAEIHRSIEARLDAMQASLDASVKGKLAEIEAAQATATRSAGSAALLSALARIAAAIDSGSEFTEALAVVRETSGAEIPQELTDMAETGAPTLAQLQHEFPNAARAALSQATRDAAADGSISPLAAFFRTQLGARSLEPREGNDPDAVLSRAEAALGAGDLDTALAEIERLPQAGRNEMAEWVAKAESRRGALAALATLSPSGGAY